MKMFLNKLNWPSSSENLPQFAMTTSNPAFTDQAIGSRFVCACGLCRQLVPPRYMALTLSRRQVIIIVSDPGKGGCVDPVNRGAILEGGGTGPPGGSKERQLSPDKGRGKT
jgi:hypothetical protein